MNKDIALYKQRFLTCALLLSYSYLHVKLTGIFSQATLQNCIDLAAPNPFAQRMLIPLLARSLSFVLPLDTAQLFFLCEVFFVSIFYFSLKRLLKFEFSSKEAQLLSWLFFLLLPLVSVINYRYLMGGEAAIFYPWDTPTLFFMTIGFLLCLQSKWIYLAIWIFFATFNRESSVLLLLLIPALHWQHLRTIVKPLCGCLFAFILARLIISFLLHNQAGIHFQWQNDLMTHTLFEINLFWLLEKQNLFLFIFCFAGLPTIWFAFYDYIPQRYRPIRYVALIYFLGLLMVGIEFEARIFGEILILLYLPVAVAIHRWITGFEPDYVISGLLGYINRYAVITSLLLVVLLRHPLNKLLLWLFK